jgi:hypothetical protein
MFRTINGNTIATTTDLTRLLDSRARSLYSTAYSKKKKQKKTLLTMLKVLFA